MSISSSFFHKNVLYLILYQDIKQNVLLSPYLDSNDITNFEISLESTFKAMADRGKKRGRRKYKNLNISRTKRAF